MSRRANWPADWSGTSRLNMPVGSMWLRASFLLFLCRPSGVGWGTVRNQSRRSTSESRSGISARCGSIGNFGPRMPASNSDGFTPVTKS